MELSGSKGQRKGPFMKSKSGRNTNILKSYKVLQSAREITEKTQG